MIEVDHEDAGLDVEVAVAAGKMVHVLGALLASMRLEAIGGSMAREANRVAAILARDAEYAEVERARQAASIELDNGLTVNLVDTVVPPTPEWLAKAPVRAVYVGADNWTDRGAHEPVRTVRRIPASMAYKIHTSGRITERQMKACAWYRDRYEVAGMEGNIKGASFEPRIAGGTTSGLPFSDIQMEAQDEYRNARLMLPMGLRTFFELVVIQDRSLTQARKQAKAGKDPLDSFKCCTDRVADYIEFSTGKRL